MHRGSSAISWALPDLRFGSTESGLFRDGHTEDAGKRNFQPPRL